MTASSRRGRKLLALALASTTVVVAGSAQMAHADTKSTTSSVYTSTSNSSALQLVVTLPAALATVTGAVLPNPITLNLINTSGESTHDGKTADVATSIADLAQGSILDQGALASLLGPLLKHTVTSNLSDTNPSPYSLLSLPSNALGLNLAVGPLTAVTNGSSRAATSSGGITGGSLGSLETLAPSLVSTLQTTFSQVNAGLSTATTTLASAVQGAADALAPVTDLLKQLPTLTIPVSQILPGAQDITLNASTLSATDLTNVITALPALLTSVENDLLNGSVLGLKGILTSSALSPLGNGTTSTGSTNTGDISLFGGLLNVTASKATATASAPGVAGKAAADASATLVKVSLGDDANKLLDLVAAEQGITAQLLPSTALGSQLSSTLQQVLSTVNAGLNTALSTLTTLLQSLNSDAKILTQGTVTKSASPDGTHAEAHAAPAQVVLGLPGAANLVALSLGKVDVVANQANTTTTTTTQVAPPKDVPTVTTKPTVPTKKLAYTGADLPLTAGAALLLLGAAAGVTRRRRAHASSEQ